MAWSSVTSPTGGTQVATSAFGIPVAGNMAILGNAWTDDAAARASTAIWTTTGASVGNGTLVSRYRLAGKTLDWLVILTFGSTTSAGSSQFTFAYPAGVSPLNAGAGVTVRYFDNSAPATYLGMGVVNSGTVNLNTISTALGQLTAANSTTPMTWGTSDVCAFLLTGCEVA